MSAKKVYRYLLIVFLLGLGLSFWIVKYASSWLSQSTGDLTTLRSEVQQLEKKRDALELAKTTLSKSEANIDILSKAIPTDKDQARVVQEIYAIAEKSNIYIESVGFPASTLGTSTTAKPATTTPSDSTTTTEVKTTATKSVSQATPIKDIPGVQSIEVSLGSIQSRSLPAGSGVFYDEMLSFIQLLERNQRTTQIRSIGIGQDTTVNGMQTFDLTLSLNIFIRS